jgi:outer membrane protein TolC
MRSVLLAAGPALPALVALAAFAQPAPEGATVPLTETEFLAAAQADSLLARSLEDVGAAETARRRAAGTPANPGLEAERESPGEGAQTTARLTWRPPLDGRRAAAIDAADAAVEAAGARRALAELDVRLSLRAAFADWAIAEERARLIGAERVRLDDLARRAEERARQGEDSGLTARRFRFAAVEMGADDAAARAEAARARAEVAALWPAAAGRSPVLPDLPGADLGSLPESPALTAARADRARADHEARLAGRFVSFPELSAGWQWQDDAGAKADGPVVGLAWELPLFDRNGADRERARREATAAGAREELLRRRMEATVAGRRDAYRTLRDAALAGGPLDESARTAVDGAAAAYGHGEITMTDFLDTIRSILAGRLAALDLHAAALAAHRELERAAGRPLAR